MIQTLKLEYSILILDIWIFHQYPECKIVLSLQDLSPSSQVRDPCHDLWYFFALYKILSY